VKPDETQSGDSETPFIHIEFDGVEASITISPNLTPIQILGVLPIIEMHGRSILAAIFGQANQPPSGLQVARSLDLVRDRKPKQ
jgi:hypothetical protein